VPKVKILTALRHFTGGNLELEIESQMATSFPSSPPAPEAATKDEVLDLPYSNRCRH
jgi:hypothetical protein